MSKTKSLLTESEFKKFASLSKLEKVAGKVFKENFLKEMSHYDEEDEEDKNPPGSRFGKPMQEEADMEVEMEPEDDMAPEGDMGPEDDMAPDDMEGEGGDVRMQIEDALQNLLGLIDDALGKAGIGDVMDVETAEDTEGEEGVEGGDPMAAPPDPMEDEEALQESDAEELTEMVAKRVMARLKNKKALNAKADNIANRVMERLSKRK